MHVPYMYISGHKSVNNSRCCVNKRQQFVKKQGSCLKTRRKKNKKKQNQLYIPPSMWLPKFKPKKKGLKKKKKTVLKNEINELNFVAAK